LIAIVTGADSGIGRATALALAARGFDVGPSEFTARKTLRGGEAPLMPAGKACSGGSRPVSTG